MLFVSVLGLFLYCSSTVFICVLYCVVVDVLSYCERLVCAGFLVFAVRGVGCGDSLVDALGCAKVPINVPRGFNYCFDCAYMFKDVSLSTLRLLRSGVARGIGVPGLPNCLVFIDVDPGFTSHVHVDRLFRLFPPDKCFVEATPRGGLHIALYVDDPRLVDRLCGVKGMVDIKARGYVVTYPTRLLLMISDRSVEVGYVKLSSVDLWDVEACLSKYFDSVKRLLDMCVELKIASERGLDANYTQIMIIQKIIKNYRNRLEKTDINELYKIDPVTGLNIDEVRKLLQEYDIDFK